MKSRCNRSGFFVCLTEIILDGILLKKIIAMKIILKSLAKCLAVFFALCYLASQSLILGLWPEAHSYVNVYLVLFLYVVVSPCMYYLHRILYDYSFGLGKIDFDSAPLLYAFLLNLICGFLVFGFAYNQPLFFAGICVLVNVALLLREMFYINKGCLV